MTFVQLYCLSRTLRRSSNRIIKFLFEYILLVYSFKQRGNQIVFVFLNHIPNLITKMIVCFILNDCIYQMIQILDQLSIKTNIKKIFKTQKMAMFVL